MVLPTFNCVSPNKYVVERVCRMLELEPPPARRRVVQARPPS